MFIVRYIIGKQNFTMNSANANDAIINQLVRILGSDQFTGAFRIKRLLEYIVNEALAGRAQQIKAYNIGLAVFDRAKDFDPQSDPIVRINASRLRRHLDAYYANSGENDEIFITVPKGTYVPHFDRTRSFHTDQNTRERDTCIALLGGNDIDIKAASGFTEPLIAVLPFTDLSGGDTPVCLLDGFSDELSALLAHFDDIKVIDYFSMAKFRGQPLGIRDIGRKLGVDYLISGNIKAEKDSIKIRTSVSEAKSAVQVWSHVFEHSISGQNLAETLSKVIGEIISAVAGDFGVLYRERGRDIYRKAQGDLTHYEAMFMHRHAQLTGNWKYSPQIKKALEKALADDPGFAMGWALLGEMYLDRYAHEYSDSTTPLDQGYTFARNAVQRDMNCQYAHFVLSYSHVLRRESEMTIRAAEKVWDLNQNAAFLVGGASFWACIAGDFERGLTYLNRSVQLNPYYPGWFHHAPFLLHLKQGNYKRAQAEADKFHMPDFFWSYIDKAVAAGLMGDSDKARIALNKITELHPDFANHPGYYVNSFVMDKELMRKMLEGLRIAGLHIT